MQNGTKTSSILLLRFKHFKPTVFLFFFCLTQCCDEVRGGSNFIDWKPAEMAFDFMIAICQLQWSLEPKHILTYCLFKSEWNNNLQNNQMHRNAYAFSSVLDCLKQKTSALCCVTKPNTCSRAFSIPHSSSSSGLGGEQSFGCNL